MNRTVAGGERRSARPEVRVAALFAVAALVTLFVLMMVTAFNIRDVDGSGTTSTELLGLPVFESTKSGRTTTLSPRIGVAVLLVVVPSVAGVVTFAVRRSTGG